MTLLIINLCGELLLFVLSFNMSMFCTIPQDVNKNKPTF